MRGLRVGLVLDGGRTPRIFVRAGVTESRRPITVHTEYLYPISRPPQSPESHKKTIGRCFKSSKFFAMRLTVAGDVINAEKLCNRLSATHTDLPINCKHLSTKFGVASFLSLAVSISVVALPLLSSVKTFLAMRLVILLIVLSISWHEMSITLSDLFV